MYAWSWLKRDRVDRISLSRSFDSADVHSGRSFGRADDKGWRQRNKDVLTLYINGEINVWIGSWNVTDTTYCMKLYIDLYHISIYWGRVTHMCVSKLNIIAPYYGLSPGRHQAISIWINAGILLTGLLGTTFSEICREIHAYALKKLHLKMSSAKWWQFRFRLSVLIVDIFSTLWHFTTSKNWLLIVNRFRYTNNNVTKDSCSTTMDMTIMPGPLKCSLRATIDHHSPPIHSGYYITSIKICKNILLQRQQNCGVWNY